jgi:hypothetical protein
MPITATLPLAGTVVVAPGGATAVIALSLLALALWLRTRRAVSGTTLLAAWGWTGVTLAAQSAAAWACTRGETGLPAAWSYLAAVTVFGPTMAVLGAKRPQHRAWQWIVLVLLIVLAMPGLEALLFGRQSVLLHVVPAALAGLLIALAVFNYLPTRFWLGVICLGVGETLLMAPYLPGAVLLMPEPKPVVALACEVLAMAVAACSRRSRSALSPIDRTWRDFRDSVGAIWALRVQERFNAAARQHAWPLELGWSGLTTVDGRQARLVPQEATSRSPGSIARRDALPERTLRMLLCRFVSEAWIKRRQQSAGAAGEQH